jgi:hypothetical protein
MNEDPMRRIYTKKQLDIILRMWRRKTSTYKSLQKFSKQNDKAMNLIMSDLSSLYYVEEEGKTTKTGTLKLNHKGETVAKVEFDRRFDMYYSRALTFLSLVTSIVALFISARK